MLSQKNLIEAIYLNGRLRRKAQPLCIALEHKNNVPNTEKQHRLGIVELIIG